MRFRTGRRAICICAVALGLMAFGSSSAQASNWMINGVNQTEAQLPFLLLSLEHSSLLTRIAGVHVLFLCLGIQGVEVHLRNLGRILGRVRFINCKTILKTKKEEEKAEGGKVSGPCEPFTGTEKGVIVTEEGEGTLGEHSTGEGVTVLKPKTGETLAVIHMGAECSIGSEVPVIGQLGIVDSGGMAGLLTEAKVHTIRPGPLTELWTISKTEEHKATISGEVKAELKEGELWSGLLP